MLTNVVAGACAEMYTREDAIAYFNSLDQSNAAGYRIFKDPICGESRHVKVWRMEWNMPNDVADQFIECTKVLPAQPLPCSPSPAS